jgi:4,5:9,10-diseco-3-hydroxy-5,9,17-trioxoandrosta-1(10),2-diene-4-oate hydrolase
MGYGYSTKPEDGTFSLDDVAAQYKALLDALDVDRVTVVGNSQGGAIAITMALNYPEFVEKLVLMAPGGLEAREIYMEMEGIQAMLIASCGHWVMVEYPKLFNELTLNFLNNDLG